MVVLLGLVRLVVLVAAVIAGVAGVLAWLSVLLVRALRTSRWGRGLAQTAAVSQDRDNLRDIPRGYTASTPGDEDTDRNGSDPRLRGPSLFTRRPAHPQAAPPAGALASQAPGPSPAARPELPAARAVAVPAGAPAD